VVAVEIVVVVDVDAVVDAVVNAVVDAVVNAVVDAVVNAVVDAVVDTVVVVRDVLAVDVFSLPFFSRFKKCTFYIRGKQNSRVPF
jgi:hypothetical protein